MSKKQPRDSVFFLFIFVMVGALSLLVPDADAYERYKDNAETPGSNCSACHGDFTSGDSMKNPAPVFPGNDKHEMHRSTMGTDCDLCHTKGDGRNPYTGSSNGTTGTVEPGLGCTGCHDGVGLRAHHDWAGITLCATATCHPSDPTPLPENTTPPYYGSVDTNADDPCNPVAAANTNENWTIGDFLGLDNDGDGLYDTLDPDCGGIEICDNGTDDDGDSLIDCLDSDCDGQFGCEFGTELTCNDAVDNDGDGLIDCADDNCAGQPGDIAGNLCELTEASCFDSFDNDADSMTDCVDPDCDGATDGPCTVAGQSGECANGTLTCSVGTEVCQQVIFPEPAEICTNTLDNDCDGLLPVDDPDCAGVEDCFNGTDDDNDTLIDCADPDCNGATNGACITGEPGICSDGTRTCNSGAEICVRNNDPVTELCDGLDNDCDGLNDNGFPDLNNICTVGIGECEVAGTYVCTPDGLGTECNVTPGTPQPEICDGLDNDCNGVNDNNFPDLGMSCTVGVGPCGNTGAYVCTGDGSDTECNAAPLPAPEPGTEITCNDGIDNDCDNLTDTAQDPDCGATPAAPPVFQTIGIPDGIFNDLAEPECRICHEDPSIVSGDSHIPNRHHLLYGSDIQTGGCSVHPLTVNCLSDSDCDPDICSRTGVPCTPATEADDCSQYAQGERCGELCIGETVAPDTDADQNGVSDTTYQCLSCHLEVIDGGFIVLQVERDCLECHVQIPGEASVHHLSATAQGTDSPLGTPGIGDCTPCHGTLVDDIGDGHAIPTYQPSLVTPSPSGGDGLPDNSYGNGAGACNHCHDQDTEPPLNPVNIYANDDTHHNTGVYKNEIGVTNSEACFWCHDVIPPTSDALAMRTCEGCHGYESLHNIAIDSDTGCQFGDPGCEVLIGGELPGYSHVGNDDDCWGCHGFAQASAPGAGPATPYISSTSVLSMAAGTDTEITLTGSAFTNLVGTSLWTSDIILTAADGSSVTLTPESITSNQLTVTVPGTTAPGNYALRAAKGIYAESNPIVIAVVPKVAITDVNCSRKRGVLTVSGSGFGDKPAGTDADIHVEVDGQTVDITSWSDTQITASVSNCSNTSTITVNALMDSATSGGGGKPAKPDKGKGNK